MATRRANLRTIYANAAAAGLSAQDLLDDIDSWSANGGSGVETYINDTKGKVFTKPNPCDDKVAAVKAALQSALNSL